MDEIEPLVRRAAAADAGRADRLAAFGALVERFQDMACGYAYAILGDFHLAQDAAQEAFLAAFGGVGGLREPGAFAGWLRRIVQRQCGRLTRRKRVATAPLAAAEEVPAAEAGLAAAAQEAEMRDEVLDAVRSLPTPQREVTTLFYINGYSQKDIAEFLEVPVTTVNNRLHASRTRLKRRMLKMVEETLHAGAPDERFRRSVIDKLLARPRPLEIPDHPVRQVWDAICGALPDYEIVPGDEIVDRDTQVTVSGGVGFVCRDPGKVLRTCTTVATFCAMVGRKPPVRLLTAGRVFRGTGADGVEDQTHLKVFRQADALCIEEGADREAMLSTVTRVMEAVFEATSLELRWQAQGYPLFVDGAELSMKLRGQWTDVAGAGMLPAERLREAGYDPQQVSCFAFGLGLERLAMLRCGLDDIRALWRPPYVPA